MPRKLKVFRTPIGFDDAYVAAPSMKAALEAWGSTANLFTRGVAEQVTDPRLIAEPLKHPGQVIRVSRGDLKAQLKALGPRKARAGGPAKRKPQAETPAPKPVKQKAPPRRDSVDKAEAALGELRAVHAKEQAALEKQIEALETKLDALKKRQAKSVARAEARLARAQADYRDALDKWTA